MSTTSRMGSRDFAISTCRLIVLCAIAMLASAIILAQTAPAPPAASFEAASVKVRKYVPFDPLQPDTIAGTIPVMRGGPGTGSPGRIRYSNVTLKSLILKAYDFEADQLIGPSWLTEDRYDVDAVVPPGATMVQFRHMLQNLLAERFRLIARWEEKDFRVYRLVVSNGSPKLKPSLVTSADDDDNLAAKRVMAATAAVGKDGCPIIPPTRRYILGGGDHCFTLVGYSMAELAFQLGEMVAVETGTSFGPNRSWAHIVDATGLSGRFDFTLKYDLTYHSMMNTPGLPEAMRAQLTSTYPASIFKAVEAQLGLKLEPVTSRLKVMIVLSADRIPTGN